MEALHEVGHRHRVELEVADYYDSPERAEKPERDIQLVGPAEEREIASAATATAEHPRQRKRHAKKTEHRDERRHRRIVDDRPVEPGEKTRRLCRERRGVATGGDERRPPVEYGDDIVYERKREEDCRADARGKKDNDFFHSIPVGISDGIDQLSLEKSNEKILIPSGAQLRLNACETRR